MKAFLQRISAVYAKLLRELRYRFKSKVNNKLLVNKKLYSVWLGGDRPYICIITDKISAKYDLFLEDHLGLDLDGDCVRIIIINNGMPLAINPITGIITRICVGKEIK